MLRQLQAEYTTAELIELAAQAGYKNVTPVMLAQWHRYGLLPKPHKKSLGRKGSVSVYSGETGRWLLDLLGIHKAEGGRRRLIVAWRLWWMGWPVSKRRVRELLARVAEKIDPDRDALAAQSAEEREATVQDLYRREVPPDARAFTRTRQRLRGDSPQLLRVIAEAATGPIEFSSDDLRLMQRAGGRARVGAGKPSLTDVPPMDPTGHAMLSAWLQPLHQPMGQLLESLSDEELDAARDEVCVLFTSLQDLVRATSALRIRGDVVVTDWTPPQDVWTQAGFILVWHNVCAYARAGQEVASDPVEASTAAARVAKRYEILRTLSKSETFADLLSPERLSLAVVDKHSMEHLLIELQARIDEHRDEAWKLAEEAKAD
jgi:hypothetical protein